MSSARKLYFEKFTWDLNIGRNCFRDVGLYLIKYRWAINKSLQGVPIEVNEFKIEITLEILGLGDQLDISGKLTHFRVPSTGGGEASPQRFPEKKIKSISNKDLS